MGAPILLGGATFQVNRGSLGFMQRSDALIRKPDPEGYAVLAEVSAALRDRGQKTTKPRRGKRDVVRLRCVLENAYVEVLLIVEPHPTDVLSFSLDAWGYTKPRGGAIRRDLEDTWKRMAAVIDEVIRSRFAAESVTWQSPREVDARYGA